MIVTDRFVFIHLHKTGGQTLNRVIAACIPDHRPIGYHYPYSNLPDEYHHLPVVGVVRNPWDWYVSWYSFNKGRDTGNPLFKILSKGGSADFETTVTNLICLGDDSESSIAHRAALKDVLPESLDNNRGVGLTKSDMDHLSGAGCGYLSWLFSRMLGTDGDLHVARFENLAQSFVDIMQQLGVEQVGEIANSLSRAKRNNASSHSHYSHYYDDDLRDLVASSEKTLIHEHGYEFDNVGGTAARASDSPGGSFRKLLGRGENYLQLHDGMDVSVLAEKLKNVTEEQWTASGRERRFDVHKDTQALMLIHFEDHKDTEPEYRDLYDEYADQLQPFVKHIEKYYQDNGFVVRLIFAKLAAGGRIPEHTDTGYSLLACHRVHIPIITNDAATFYVGGEEKVMRAGEFWEIDNAGRHAVHNRGNEDRIHLIIDWMPNPNGLPHREVVKQTQSGDPVADKSESLQQMVAEAFQLQRAGNVQKARSMYKQVLDIDPGHVEANNLLGLLSLQARQPADAVQYIERALQRKADDAQAWANLGLAQKDLGRITEAVASIGKAVEINPNNPKTHLNLGNLKLQLGDNAGAVSCYEAALSIVPNYAEARRNLGSVMLRMERFAEAVNHLRQAVMLKPDFLQAKKELEQALKALAQQQRG